MSNNAIPIYQFTDYKQYIREWIARRNQRGLISRIAEATAVSPSMISQILKGDKHFTAEQSADLSDFLGLTELESEYFFLLIEKQKAGTSNLQKKIEHRISKLKSEILKISQVALHEKELSEALKAEYYSSWIFTGIRNYLAAHSQLELGALSQNLNIPLEHVHRVFNFLISNGLIRVEGNLVKMGASHMHLGADSPFIANHHRNWREKAIERMPFSSDQELHYTCPMSLSKEAAEQVRAMLPQFIEQILKVVGPSPSETVRCLNIDWFSWEK